MDSKKEEMLNKAAKALNDGAKKVDSMVDKRSALGELSPAVTVGLLAIVVVSVINSPNLLLLGAIVGAVAMAPKIVRFVKERKAAMVKKDAPPAPNQEQK